MRIVSLLPAATEILHSIGAAGDLVGRSHECDRPEDITHLPVLTAQRTRFETAAQVDRDVAESIGSGTSLYTLDEDRLRELHPDLIVTQDLCDVCSIDLAAVRRVAAAMAPEPRVLSLNPHTFEGVLDDVIAVGDATGRAEEASRVVVRLHERMDRAMSHVPAFGEAVGVLFLEWTDPPFAPGHWTPQLIERAGGEHPLNPTAPVATSGSVDTPGPLQAERVAGKSIRVTPERITDLDRAGRFDRLVICPCGMTLEQTRREVRRMTEHVSWFAELSLVRKAMDSPAPDDPASQEALANSPVVLVDGNAMFARPGPRLVDAFEWLVAWLQHRPELVPAGFPAEAFTG